MQQSPPIKPGHFYPGEDYYKHLARWFSNHYCKTFYHAHMDPHMKLGLTEETREHVERIWKRPICNKIEHAMTRTLRHLHDEPVRMIIETYLQHKKGTTSVENARETLSRALQMEIRNFWSQTKREDRHVLRFLAQDKGAQDQLHHGLLSLGDNVWMIEWCGDWKSINLFWNYKYGPGWLLVTRTKNNMRPLYFTLGKQCVHLNGRFLADDKRNLRRLKHDDLARIIRHAWAGTLDEIFSYDAVYLKKKCVVHSGDLAKFKRNVEQLNREWQSEDENYCTKRPDDKYRWTPNAMPSNARLGNNPYCCQLFFGSDDSEDVFENDIEGDNDSYSDPDSEEENRRMNEALQRAREQEELDRNQHQQRKNAIDDEAEGAYNPDGNRAY